MDCIKYVKIKDLIGRYFLSETSNGKLRVEDKWIDVTYEHDQPPPEYPNYDWKSLIDDIKENGIINSLRVVENSNYLSDGNHRFAIAELLYPPDKEIPCTTFISKMKISLEQIKMQAKFHRDEDKSYKTKPGWKCPYKNNYWKNLKKKRGVTFVTPLYYFPSITYAGTPFF